MTILNYIVVCFLIMTELSTGFQVINKEIADADFLNRVVIN